MNEVISLSSPAALDIRDGNLFHQGGTQDWYTDRWQQQSGCGPTNCANLLWYLVKTRKRCNSLCRYDAALKPGFVRLMEDVWQYVTPGRMGVNTTELFMDGVKRYGEAKGIPLKTDALNVAPILRGVRSYNNVSAFITQSLKCNLPVAFLNLSNGALRNLDNWHWVTLVALNGDEAMIYDQGKAFWINLRRWVTTTIMGGGFVNIEIPS